MGCSQNPDAIDWSAHWDPQLRVENLVPAAAQTHVWRSVARDAVTGAASVTERRRVKALFVERMELAQFPFDTQVGVT